MKCDNFRSCLHFWFRAVAFESRFLSRLISYCREERSCGNFRVLVPSVASPGTCQISAHDTSFLLLNTIVVFPDFAKQMSVHRRRGGFFRWKFTARSPHRTFVRWSILSDTQQIYSLSSLSCASFTVPFSRSILLWISVCRLQFADVWRLDGADSVARPRGAGADQLPRSHSGRRPLPAGEHAALPHRRITSAKTVCRNGLTQAKSVSLVKQGVNSKQLSGRLEPFVLYSCRTGIDQDTPALLSAHRHPSISGPGVYVRHKIVLEEIPSICPLFNHSRSVSRCKDQRTKCRGSSSHRPGNHGQKTILWWSHAPAVCGLVLVSHICASRMT